MHTTTTTRTHTNHKSQITTGVHSQVESNWGWLSKPERKPCAGERIVGLKYSVMGSNRGKMLVLASEAYGSRVLGRV